MPNVDEDMLSGKKFTNVADIDQVHSNLNILEHRFLTKPFSQTDLKTKLRSELEREAYFLVEFEI